MKSAAEYLDNHVFEARRPRRDLQPVVAYDIAVQAIEKALADAEKYKYLLMRSLRHHADLMAVPSPMISPDMTSVLPLYPVQERMAA